MGLAGRYYAATRDTDTTWFLPDDVISPALDDGVYDVLVTITDSQGRVGTDVTTDELTIDTLAPIVTVDSLVTIDSTPELTGTVDDPTATLQITVDGGMYTAINHGDGTWTLPDNTISPALDNGVYDIHVTATDAAGNVGTDGTTDELSVYTPGITISPISGLLVAEGGGDDAFTIVLDSEPTADVTITLTPDAQVELSVDGGFNFSDSASLTFGPADWMTPQTVVVRAVDDSQLEGNHVGLVSFSTASADPDYDALPVDDLTIDIIDNETVNVESVVINDGSSGGRW